MAQAQETLPGADVQTLLAIAREANPEYASMRYEAQAAAERVTSAGALPDPKFRTELRDITKLGEQSPTLSPSDVGSTRYLLMQDIPWFGKRDLRRDIAAFEAEGTQGRAMGTWSDLAAKIKIAHAQRYFLHRNEKLTQEILDLVIRLEKVAQARYAGGLAAQQDVIRAQIEQTNMNSELVALASEGRQVNARLNALLARPASAPLAEPQRLRAL
ncbi:MAG: TolC family protein, partial [Rhodoferax sp.]